MAISQRTGEIQTKGAAKPFHYFQIHSVADIESAIAQVGTEQFMKAVNAALESLARQEVKNAGEAEAPQQMELFAEGAA